MSLCEEIQLKESIAITFIKVLEAVPLERKLSRLHADLEETRKRMTLQLTQLDKSIFA